MQACVHAATGHGHDGSAMAVKWVSAALFGLGLTAAGGARRRWSQRPGQRGRCGLFGDCSEAGSTFRVQHTDPRTGNIFTDRLKQSFSISFGDTVYLSAWPKCRSHRMIASDRRDLGRRRHSRFTFTPFAPTAPAGAMLNSMAADRYLSMRETWETEMSIRHFSPHRPSCEP